MRLLPIELTRKEKGYDRPPNSIRPKSLLDDDLKYLAALIMQIVSTLSLLSTQWTIDSRFLPRLALQSCLQVASAGNPRELVPVGGIPKEA